MDLIWNGPFYIKVGFALYTVVQYLEYIKRLKAVGHFAKDSYMDIQRYSYSYNHDNHKRYLDQEIQVPQDLDHHIVQEDYLEYNKNPDPVPSVSEEFLVKNYNSEL
jgi:hypothetical protein